MPLNLLSKRTYRRALGALTRALNGHPDIVNIRHMVAQNSTGRALAKMPGFNLFSPGGAVSPYDWMLPMPPGDESTLIYAYETLADLPPERAGRPGRMPAAVFAEVSAANARRMGFESARLASDWKMVALLLLGYAQKLAKENIRCGAGGVYSLHISGAYMEVTPDGCYSNFKQQLIRKVVPNATTVEDLFSVRPAMSGEPVICALAPICKEVGQGALYALNTLARGIDARGISAREVSETLLGSVEERPRKERYDRLGGAGRRQTFTSLAGCDDAVNGLRAGIIQDLFTLREVLVPHAYTRRKFEVAFGRPEDAPNRLVRPKTLLKWADKIEAHAAQLKDRNIMNPEA